MSIVRTKTNTKRFDKRHFDANDQYIGNIVVYGNTEDSKLYVDAEKTTEVSAAQAEDLFVKGLLVISVGTAMFVPVAFTGSAVITISVVESAVTATSWTVE